MNRLVIITAIFGDRDILTDPEIIHDGVDYYAFVDRKFDKCNIWKQIIIPDFSSDNKYKNRRNSKIYKIIPHLYFPNHEFHFWIDANWEIRENPYKLCDEYLNSSDICVYKHPTRKCAYVEARHISHLDHKNVISDQQKFYKNEGFPENFGLYACGIMLRRNTDKIKVLNLKWYEQICKYSSRDQVSFPYCLFKLGIEPSTFKEQFFNSKLIKRIRDHAHN